MAEVTPESNGGVSRRTLLGNGLLAGLAVPAIGLARPDLKASARVPAPGSAAASKHAVTPDSFGYQFWTWCSKCQGLFFGAQQSESSCPAGGNHNGASSYQYIVVYNFPPTSNVQANWRWCRNCRGLVYGPTPFVGICPAGGTHDCSGSFDYSLGFNGSPASGVQVNWRWCNRCQGLFDGSHQSTSVCPAGGNHNGGGSYDYGLNYQ
jgi:hypothetical protein